MKRKRIAIVVQRYGEEVNGGAELHARWLAEHLLSLADVHVITTCAIDYTTWANDYGAGDTELNGVHIHRFPVDATRNWRRSQKRTGQLLNQVHTLFDEYRWVKEQGPYSTQLLEFVRESRPFFDAFIFYTYIYATTFFGLPLVADKAILVPTAHDEPFLYLPVFRSLFHLPQAIVYNTEPEKELVHRITHNDNRIEVVAGIGIDLPETISAKRFRENYDITGDFLLYVGRINEAKNVPELLAYFRRFRQVREAPVKLVLIGRSHIDLPQHPDIIHLGFVSEADKFDAIQAATLVVIPSLYESLSMIALEAWAMRTPVLANGQCAVLKYQCQRSNGGLYYTSFDEFEATTNRLLDSLELRARLGESGCDYVCDHYDWRVIIAAYEAVISTVTTPG